MSPTPLELWQTEWCPSSHRVRQRLTELGLSYFVRQVPVEREDRAELVSSTGQQSIPALLADGKVIAGEDAIVTYLNTHFAEPPEAEHQREGRQSEKKGPGESMSGIVSTYTLNTTTPLSFDQAVGRVRDELAAEGFGVLCEIDVQATLEQKLGVEREPYLILGACNPPLAHAALEAEPELGTLLPCNVVVYQQLGETHISAVDAAQMLSIVGNDELAPTAREVRRRLMAVVERAAGVAGSR
jgi:uncharacterized protein (DUF302 family)/glutaredoxin